MIQTVCLIRNKTDDICATFILEFFKLIGCVVQDYVIKEEDRPKEIFFEEYDLNIILGSISDNNLFNMSNYSTSLILFVLIPDTANSFSWLQSQGNTLLFKEIISRVWNKPEDIQSLFILTNVYAQNNLFYFLYNKGNLKFVEEYYPVYGKSQKRITESRESAMRETFIAYAKSYNTLVESEMKQQLQSIHYDYALLLLKYKLNDMDRMLEGSSVFRTKDILKKVDEILNVYPDFVRAHYLRACVCSADSKYLWEAENYYIRAIESMKQICPNSGSEDFLYYQAGRYYEKIRKNPKLSYKCYKASYKCNKRAFRSMLKIAEEMKEEGNFSEVIDLCNAIITITLNGYHMQDLMPKQQIYVYKTFVLLGDAFYAQKDYILAEKSYTNAVRISKAGSFFYQCLDEDENEAYKWFNDVLETCMPTQPIYMKLLSCAAKCANVEKAKECFSKLEYLDNGEE